MTPITILLVDDQTLVRQGIQTLLELEPDLRVVGSASDGQQGVVLALALHPAVVLMDVRMPVMDGVAATRAIAAQLPETRVIMLTTFDDDAPIFAALRAGARGYLLKDVESDELTRAVRAVAAGQAFIQPRLTARVIDALAAAPGAVPRPPPLAEPLTEREDAVLHLLAAGLANREIAARLVITEGTVKNHVSNILAKLDVRDRTQALLRAQALGLLRTAGTAGAHRDAPPP